MISCFGNHFKPQDPTFSFLGTSLLAATTTFGEVAVIATKRTYFSKTLNYFPCRFRPQMCALVSPAMKKKLRSNFPWLSTTIKIYHCPCDLLQAKTHNSLSINSGR